MDKKEEKGESEKCEEKKKKNLKSPSGFYSLQKQDGPV